MTKNPSKVCSLRVALSPGGGNRIFRKYRFSRGPYSEGGSYPPSVGIESERGIGREGGLDTCISGESPIVRLFVGD